MLLDDNDERAQELAGRVVGLAGIRPIKGTRADILRALVMIALEEERLQKKIAKMLVGVSMRYTVFAG